MICSTTFHWKNQGTIVVPGHNSNPRKVPGQRVAPYEGSGTIGVWRAALVSDWSDTTQHITSSHVLKNFVLLGALQ